MLRSWPLALAFALLAGGCSSGGCSSGGTSSAAATTTGGASCVPGASVSCSCIDGQMGAQVCQADGHSFGACFCVGSSSASTASGSGGNGGSSSTASGGGGGSLAIGDAYWAKAFGGTSGAAISALADAGSGAVIVGGLFAGAIQLGTTNATCGTNDDLGCAFIAKLDPNGDVLWAKAFVGDASSSVFGTELAVAPNGDVYVAGGFGGAIDFGSGPVGGAGLYVYLSKYDGSGTPLASFHYLVSGGGTAVSANGAVVQSSGDLVIEGYTDGTIDFGQGAVGPGTYLVDFASSGLPSFSTSFADTSQSAGPGSIAGVTLGRTAGDGLVLAGSALANADLGCGALTAGAAFVADLDASGVCLLSSSYPGAVVASLAVDPSDDSTTVAGALTGGAPLTIGPDTVTNVGTSDVLLFHLDAGGQGLWAKSFGTSGKAASGSGVAIAPSSGNIGLTGAAEGAIDFGGGGLPAHGGAFAAVFARDATYRWAGLAGDDASGAACASAASNKLQLAGKFSGTIGFPSKVIQSNGPSSGFAAELAVP